MKVTMEKLGITAFVSHDPFSEALSGPANMPGLKGFATKVRCASLGKILRQLE